MPPLSALPTRGRLIAFRKPELVSTKEAAATKISKIAATQASRHNQRLPFFSRQFHLIGFHQHGWLDARVEPPQFSPAGCRILLLGRLRLLVGNEKVQLLGELRSRFLRFGRHWAVGFIRAGGAAVVVEHEHHEGGSRRKAVSNSCQFLSKSPSLVIASTRRFR